MTLLDAAIDGGGSPAPRLRRPSLRDPRLLIGLALVLGSVAVGAQVIASADHTVPVYAARTVLPSGTPLSVDRLDVVRVRLSGVSAAAYLDARRSPPSGQVIIRTVGAGELIPSAAVASATLVRSRPVTIPLDGMPPAGIAPGALVDVWASARRVDATQAGGYDEPRRIASAVEVFDLQRPGTGLAAARTGAVQVLLPTEGLAPVLDALANQARVVVLPLPGTAAVGRQQ